MTKEQIAHIISLNNQKESIETLLDFNGYPNKIILQEWDEGYEGIMAESEVVDCELAKKVVDFLHSELERINEELASM